MDVRMYVCTYLKTALTQPSINMCQTVVDLNNFCKYTPKSLAKSTSAFNAMAIFQLNLG